MYLLTHLEVEANVYRYDLLVRFEQIAKVSLHQIRWGGDIALNSLNHIVNYYEYVLLVILLTPNNKLEWVHYMYGYTVPNIWCDLLIMIIIQLEFLSKRILRS